MRYKHIFFILGSSILLFDFKINAYIEVSSKTTVSPGCEGGILKRSRISSFGCEQQIIEDSEDSAISVLRPHYFIADDPIFFSKKSSCLDSTEEQSVILDSLNH